MAAKGDSKQGLVITLVFFVLLSILLGVVAYLGYADQQHYLDQKDKAVADKKIVETDREFLRFQSLLMRAYTGQGDPKDMEELGLLRDRFDKGDLGAKSKDRDEIVNVVKKLDKDLGWLPPPQKKPASTYKIELAKKDKEIEALAGQVKDEAGKFAKVDVELAGKRKELDALRDEYKSKLDDLKKGGVQDLQKYVAKIEELQKDIEALGAQREALRNEIGLLQEKYDKLVKKLEKDIEDLQLRLVKTQEKLPKTNFLDLDQPKGKIVSVDRSGQMPFIDVGRADGVKPQLTFSIHGAGPDGKPTKEPKGSLEVLDVIGDRLSQARITWVKDPSRDPVLKGDLLYNMAWSPNMKQHVAIAGMVDLTGDTRPDNVNELMRNLNEFKRTLEGQNVIVDAYLDLKENAVKGQLSRQTDYLILGDMPQFDGQTPLNDADPKLQRKNSVVAQMTKMQQEAVQNGVTIISLKKFLALSGFRMPRPLNANEPAYNFRPTTSTVPSPLDRPPPIAPAPPADDKDKMKAPPP